MTEKNIHRHYTTMLYRAMSTTTTPHTQTQTYTRKKSREKILDQSRTLRKNREKKYYTRETSLEILSLCERDASGYTRCIPYSTDKFN